MSASDTGADPGRDLALLRALVERGHEAILIVDASARPIWSSPGVDRILGEPFVVRPGAEPLSRVHPDDRDGALAAFANALHADGPLPPFHARLLRADGEVRLVEVLTTNLLDDPDVGGVVLNLRDITDAPDARSAVEVTESRFRRLLENISDTVTLVDASGAVIDTTGNVKSILGYSAEFWRERNAFDVLHPEDEDRVRSFLVWVLEHPGKPFMDEVRVRHADGHYEEVEATAVNLLDVPDVRAIVLTTRNITARKEVERELAEARDTAVRALHERTAFVAGVSHELRTPIHGVLGLGELLLQSDLAPEAEELVRSIIRATESLGVVLDDILDLAKIEAGRVELHVQPVRVADVVGDLEALFRPQAEGKGLDLDLELGPDLPTRVVTDAFRLRQVLTNLLGNAVKFTEAGRVGLRVERCDAQGCDAVRFVVTDTGPGIPADAFDRIFEPFAQVEAASPGARRGTGLGLAIARQLLERMGGRLTLASTVGAGSTFTVEVPVAAPVVDDVDGESFPTVRAGTAVLVAEDNPVNQLLVQRQLERLGCTVTVVPDGADVLAALDAQPVDVVMMDCVLAGMDGPSATRELRQREAADGRPRTPVIAMTAGAMPADRTRCLEAGMDDFLAKPVSLAALAGAIAGVLGDAPAPGAVASPRPSSRAHGAPPGPEAEPSALEVTVTSIGVVDAGVIDRLAEELDDPDTVAKVLRSYLRELAPRLDALDDALRTGDRDALRRVAHTLTSTSAAVGAVGLRDLTRAVEEHCRGGASLMVLGPALVRLRAGAAAAAERLEEAVGRYDRSPWS